MARARLETRVQAAGGSRASAIMNFPAAVHPIFQKSSGSFHCRDVAQPGRALAWGARGRQFKSARPDQYFHDSLFRPVETIGTRFGGIPSGFPRLEMSLSRLLEGIDSMKKLCDGLDMPMSELVQGVDDLSPATPIQATTTRKAK